MKKFLMFLLVFGFGLQSSQVFGMNNRGPEFEVKRVVETALPGGSHLSGSLIALYKQMKKAEPGGDLLDLKKKLLLATEWNLYYIRTIIDLAKDQALRYKCLIKNKEVKEGDLGEINKLIKKEENTIKNYQEGYDSWKSGRAIIAQEIEDLTQGIL